MEKVIGTLRKPGGARLATVVCGLALMGCAELGIGQGGETPSRQSQGLDLVERTVERPDAFSLTERGLWDGRPSIGPSLWVAVPGRRPPEQVRVTNTANGRVTVAALFSKGSSIPGPSILVSDGIAEKLRMEPGVPVKLQLVALRKETIPVAPVAEKKSAKEVAAAEKAAAAEAGADTKPDTVKPRSRTAGATAAGATAAKTAAATAATAAAQTATPAVQTTAKPAAAAGDALETTVLAAIESAETKPEGLAQPYLKVAEGIPRKEARKMLAQLAKLGIPAKTRGRFFGPATVVAGPAKTEAEQKENLRKLKLLGYNDAHAVE